MTGQIGSVKWKHKVRSQAGNLLSSVPSRSTEELQWLTIRIIPLVTNRCYITSQLVN